MAYYKYCGLKPQQISALYAAGLPKTAAYSGRLYAAGLHKTATYSGRLYAAGLHKTAIFIYLFIIFFFCFFCLILINKSNNVQCKND